METPDMPLNLPTAIECYFEIDKTDDLERFSECFAPKAEVIDEERIHTGIAAIQNWAREAKAATNYHVTPLSADVGEIEAIVTGQVEGNFPGSPVTLRYFFTLEAGLIIALEIKP
ncbi:hypothetical protein HY3_06865 [Hyphomonas pacifica]|uniref:SnoaL-like domain-containing protein n=2 Tax=Hyphomonas pacifica TaxID=1280941 RepID=A0A8B2PSB0_9PROT|nr:hypothetical protein HY11_07030 [Hyphomonas pacifica]RAN35813.1 hypothetical protein HY3_06865 [Hyphomonas pacifica]